MQFFFLASNYNVTELPTLLSLVQPTSYNNELIMFMIRKT